MEIDAAEMKEEGQKQKLYIGLKQEYYIVNLRNIIVNSVWKQSHVMDGYFTE